MFLKKFSKSFGISKKFTLRKFVPWPWISQKCDRGKSFCRSLFWQSFSKTFWICLENALKTSWRRVDKNSLTWWDILKTSSRCPEDIFARSFEGVLERSWRRLEDVWLRRICSSWSRRLENVWKTSSEDVWPRRIYSSWSRCLEDVLKKFFEDKDERHLQDVFMTSSPRQILFFFSIFMIHNLNKKIKYAITRYFKNLCTPGRKIKIKK